MGREKASDKREAANQSTFKTASSGYINIVSEYPEGPCSLPPGMLNALGW